MTRDTFLSAKINESNPVSSIFTNRDKQLIIYTS